MKLKLAALLLCLLAPAALQAQADCVAAIQQDFMTAANACGGTTRNQACYGSGAITGVGRSADFTFAQSGDTVNADNVQTITLTKGDTPENWSVALLRLQGNLPDSAPGQNIVVLAFGNVALGNEILPHASVTVTTSTSARARTQPSTGGGVIMPLDPNTELQAVARNQAGNWIYVALPTNPQKVADGWVSTSVLTTADFSTLPVIATGAVPKAGTPMQIFDFKSGSADRPCDQAPDSGVLLQAPQGLQTASITVNGVQIVLTSTAYLETAHNQLTLAMIDGHAIVSALNGNQFVPPGTMVTVPLRQDGHSPAGRPSAPKPYDADMLATLPLRLPGARAPLVLPVSVAVPVAANGIADAITQAFAPYGLIDGHYAVKPTSFTQTKADTYGAGYCFSHGKTLLGVDVMNGQVQNLSASIKIVSMTEFTFVNHYEDDKTGCTVTHDAQWQAGAPEDNTEFDYTK